ncbi:PST family polysaccharide transporter [Actinomycetospora succinea]|uniref:PST family polysaccharide transporter n=1 Tax=Actinomycetospora succinea TaxID=663603 RepID=A0A4R6URY8_9PSEU|nr:lipopolysaccharide biosynthesis protein [Actinomycetospora succinea]TDQ48996.1 PST family polysaccharide transporter [Actinomycetospora succinea]
MTGPAQPGEPAPTTTVAKDRTAEATAQPSIDKLGKTLQRGAKISAIVLVVTQSISLIQTLAVARLLSPAEVGAFTAGSILANFLVTFSEGGLRAALIQREDDLEDAADTVFWVTLVNGVLMSGLAFAVSPLIGAFFGGDVAGAVCAATAAVLTIHALTNVPDGLMQRGFNFKRRMIVNPSTAVTFAGTAIALSALGFGVWGLVIALYASQIVTLVLTWWLAGWWPGRGRFNVALWREMARFALPLIASEFAQKGREFLEAGLTGRFLGQGPLGMYRYGRRIATLPGTAIIQIASYVLFPAFSRIAKDAGRLRRGFLRAMTALWVTALPAGALLVAIGEPLVVVALGEEWRGAGLVLMGMAAYGPGMALGSIGKEAIKGTGRSRLLNWITATSLVVTVIALFTLLPTLGLLGVGMAASAEAMAAGSLAIGIGMRVAGVRVRDALRVLLPVLVAGVVALVATSVLENGFFHSDQRPIIVGIGLLIVDVLVFAGLYLGLLRILSPSVSRELYAGVRSTIKRPRKKSGADAATPEPAPETVVEDAVDPITGRPTEAIPSRQAALDDAPTVVLIPSGAGRETAPEWAVAMTERLYAAPFASHGNGHGNGHRNGNGHTNGNGHSNGHGPGNGHGPNGHPPAYGRHAAAPHRPPGPGREDREGRHVSRAQPLRVMRGTPRDDG